MSERVVVVGDAHLGTADPGAEGAFLEFLAAVPSIGSRLLLLGDIFDFWFEYRSVVPRKHLRTAAAIGEVARSGTTVEFFGGNHDRWGGTFWTRDMGVAFHPRGSDLIVAGRRAFVHHGDGLSDHLVLARALQWVLSRRLTVLVYSLLHPTASFWLAEKLAGWLEGRHKTPEAMDRAASFQEGLARQMIERRPELQLVIMGHTHRQRVVELGPGRFYLNAGQWMNERHYAVVTPDSLWAGCWPDRPPGL
ncbi:MAG TPA: UDP-2,3-diacylglucosamine diphosphatase [Gemmatimonadales bacterium]|nr:UDP-2,3-diacylglucosamine diphosphatase [Gemmatimonadales bacterium]